MGTKGRDRAEDDRDANLDWVHTSHLTMQAGAFRVLPSNPAMLKASTASASGKNPERAVAYRWFLPP